MGAVQVRPVVLGTLGGIAVIGVGSIAIGATAPHWPARWLQHDRGPLMLAPRDSAARYQRLGVRRLRRIFPELGATFGGVSKSIAPDFTDVGSIEAYLVEVRRAEWVHWLSMLTWVPVAVMLPRWLAGALLVPTVAVNGAAQVILRYNKIRLYGVIALIEGREGTPARRARPSTGHLAGFTLTRGATPGFW